MVTSSYKLLRRVSISLSSVAFPISVAENDIWKMTWKYHIFKRATYIRYVIAKVPKFVQVNIAGLLKLKSKGAWN